MNLGNIVYITILLSYYFTLYVFFEKLFLFLFFKFAETAVSIRRGVSVNTLDALVPLSLHFFPSPILIQLPYISRTLQLKLHTLRLIYDCDNITHFIPHSTTGELVMIGGEVQLSPTTTVDGCLLCS